MDALLKTQTTSKKSRAAIIAAAIGAAVCLALAPLATPQADASLANGGFCIGATYDSDPAIKGMAGNCKPQATAPVLAAANIVCESVGFAEEGTVRLSWDAVPGVEAYRVMARANLPGAEWELLDEIKDSAYEPDQGTIWMDHILPNMWKANGEVLFAVDYSVDGRQAPRSAEINTKWSENLLPEDITDCL